MLAVTASSAIQSLQLVRYCMKHPNTISLMQEGFTYLAGAELPAVIVDVMRAGPGLGNIGPEQGDYNQIVKGGGHGNYKNIVLAPNSVQEMCDLTMKAFELSNKYRNPCIVLVILKLMNHGL